MSGKPYYQSPGAKNFSLSIMLPLLLLLLTFTSIEGAFTHLPALYQVTQPVDHAEGPIWDSRKSLLYFVDIHNGRLLSYNQQTGLVNAIDFGGDVAIVSPTRDNADRLVVANNRSIVALNWDGNGDKFTGLKVLSTVQENYPTSRFNDGKADSEGNLWFGTMGFEDAKGVAPNQGALYRITPNSSPSPVITPVNISNGIAWSLDNTHLYYIDSPSRLVRDYPFDAATGRLGTPRVAFDLSAHPELTGVPDGMTIDTDDNLWVALYNGGAVVKVRPTDGAVLQVIAVPAKCVTSVTFGGHGLGVLFVTTSRYSLTMEERRAQPAAGAVFAVVNTGSYGLEGHRTKVGQ